MFEEIRKCLLSHHEPKDYNRCFLIKFGDKKYYICSRCSGWYISFILFWIILLIGIDFILSYKTIILYLFPIPAIVDWSLHRFRIYDGNNFSRILTGFLIGLTFATLLYTFIKNPFDTDFWIVSIIYTVIVAIIFKNTQ